MNDNEDLLKIDVDTSGPERVVRVRGELDPHTAPRLEAALRETDPGATRLVLDVAGINFMDSTGLRIVLAAEKELAGNGVDLVVRSPSDAVRRLLEITDLLHLVETA